jgi:hypothetical protein
MNIDRLKSALALAAASCLVGLAAVPGDAHAGRQVKNTTRTSVNKDVNVNKNVNRNTNVNVNRDVDIDIDVDRDHHHPVATAAAVVTTAIVVGSVVNTLPPACTQVLVGNVVYQQCGGYWYQPQYVGSTVTYVVVNPPR